MRLSLRRGKLLRSSALAALLIAGAASGASAADPTYQFDIPAESLSQALTDFSQTSSQQIIYTEDLVLGRKSASLHGTFTAEQALDRLLAGTGLKVSVNSAGVMMVQSKNAQAASNEAPTIEDTVETVVVTGTHIPGATPASPVTTISKDDIERSGYSSAGEVLRNLPQSFAGGQNSTVVNAGGAANQGNTAFIDSPNLRGLGSESTLVLVDGRRLSFSGTQGSADISVIPLGAIKSIQILTDSASTIYGSDAVAGVVNFILDKDYTGLQATADIGGTTRGGGFDQHYGLNVGRSWDNGNIIVDYEYNDQSPLFARQRNFTSALESPFTLVPSLRQHSVFLTAQQALTSNISFFVEGIGALRSLNTFSSTPGDHINDRTHNDKYAATTGAKVDLGGTWSSELDLSSGADTLADRSTSDFGPNRSDITDRFYSAELIAHGDLFDLPAGSVKAALGGGYRRETLDFKQSEHPHTNRAIAYGYGELDIPVISESMGIPVVNDLELSGSTRFEHYSDFGRNWSSKAGIVYKPTADIRMRATLGQAFRAPTLNDLYGGSQAFLFDAQDPLSPTGSSPVLFTDGSNSALQPETATAFTLGGDYTPNWLHATTIGVTYFSIDYRNRISGFPDDLFNALVDPTVPVDVVRNPSPALQSQIIAAQDEFDNFSSHSYDPAQVAAYVNGANRNIALQRVRGIDFNLDTAIDLTDSMLQVSFNATALSLKNEAKVGLPFITLSGTVYNPPRFKGRFGLQWLRGPFELSGFVNYVSSEKDTEISPSGFVAAWTTIDLHTSYKFGDQSTLGGFRLGLAVLNAFDSDPPHLSTLSPFNAGFDSTNASGLGRVIRLELTKQW